MHIQNTMKDKGYDENDDNEAGVKEDYQRRARQLLIDSTRKNLESNFDKAKLKKHDVFIVSGSVISLLVNGKAMKNAALAIDEARLLESILKKAHERRYGTQTSAENHSSLRVIKNNIVRYIS